MIKAAIDWQDFKIQLQQAAKQFGIDELKVTSAEAFPELKAHLLAHRAQGHESGFEEKDLNLRTVPKLSMPQAQSILAIAVAYPSTYPAKPQTGPGQRRGLLARSAWGEDYHRILRKRMQALEEWIQEKVPQARCLSFVDTGPLSDRAVALRAGIGWRGKNCSVLNRKWGSWMYLGEILTNLPLPADRQIAEECGDCKRCLTACPTGALIAPGKINAKRCLSYLTQSKENLHEQDMEKMGPRLYGCDICQQVCPVNQKVKAPTPAKFLPDPDRTAPLLLPLLRMSNRVFKQTFGFTAVAWRGRKPLQRNALIALAYFRDLDAVPAIILILQQDPRADLRATAAWALGKIKSPLAEEALVEAAAAEQEAEVIFAIENAIGKFAES